MFCEVSSFNALDKEGIIAVTNGLQEASRLQSLSIWYLCLDLLI